MNDDLTFLAASSTPECNTRLDRVIPDYYTIQLMTRGEVFVAYDDAEYIMRGVWFWPAYPGPRLRFHTAREGLTWHHRHIGFKGPLVNRWIAAGLWLGQPQAGPPGPDWGEFFDRLQELSHRTDRLGRLHAINQLEQMLLVLAEHRDQREVGGSWLDAVLARLGSGSNVVPDYQSIAAEQGISLTVLRRRFKRATGTTMHNYVLQERAAAARAMLTETDLPLKTIAARLGYNNVYFFSRQFRELIGVAPGSYRKSRQ